MENHKPVGEQYEQVEELVKTLVNHTGAGAAYPDTNVYHAKVLRLEEAEQFFELKDNLDLGELPKSIIPYEHARRILFENPQNICVIDCVCRTLRGEKGCYPRDVCIIIGEPWVSWALARECHVNGRIITQDDALRILRECHERGNVHAAFFKDVAAGRLYSICNCCPCCCTALLSQNYITAPMMAGSGYIAKIDKEKCVDCGACERKCNFLAIYRDKDNRVQVNEDLCRGCEGCLGVCPTDSIKLELVDASVLAPLDIKALKAQQNG